MLERWRQGWGECLYWGILLATFSSFFLFLSLSNIFDWDHFLTTFEVDLRSWLIDLTPPLWSYQFCGGVTRWGDPQAFGLSPLFLVPLAFGSFWGTKILILLSAMGGFYFHQRILLLLRRITLGSSGAIEKDKGEMAVLALVSLFFVFSHYFLWHFHHGHVTFLLNYLALGMVYYFGKGLLFPHELTLKEKAGIVLLTWAYGSAGFYHSLIFFLLPLSIAIVLSMLWSSSRWKLFKAAGRTLLWFGGGVLLSSYKWMEVLRYQGQFPRTVTSKATEPAMLIKTWIYQLVPTWNYQYVGLGKWFSQLGEKEVWAIWEYSSFSFLPWLILILLAWKGPRDIQGFKALLNGKTAALMLVPLAIYGVVLFLFFLGSDVSFSFHRLLNLLILNNSVRVIGRYQIGLTFAFSLLLALIIFRIFRIFRLNGHEKGHKSSVRPVLITFLCCWLGWLINLGSFQSTLGHKMLQSIRSYPFWATSQMQWLIKTLNRDYMTSKMYGPTLAGLGVGNCYNPLNREIVFMTEYTSLPPKSVKKFHFLSHKGLDQGHKREWPNCLKNSYFTQNRLHLDASCPQNVCLHLNGINLYSQEEREKYSYHSKHRLYCRQ